MSRSSRRRKTPARPGTRALPRLVSTTFYRLPIGTYIDPRQPLPAELPRQRVSRSAPTSETPSTSRCASAKIVTVHGNSALPRRLSDGSLGVAYSREAIDAMFKSNGEDLQSILIGVLGINVTESVGTLAQFTAMGQRRHSNRITIDGVSADLAIDVAALGLSQAGSGTLPAFATTGGTQTLFSMSAVDEIQIRTTNASSEHARSPGAQTVIVTRSGTDQFKSSSADADASRRARGKKLVQQCRQASTGAEEAIGIAICLWEDQYFRGASSISERGSINTSIAPSSQR